jgi:hypothetical protein
VSGSQLIGLVGLWTDGRWRGNLVLANVKGVKKPWAVVTDEPPSLNTLWQYALWYSLRTQDTPHWTRGIRPLKIGLR